MREDEPFRLVGEISYSDAEIAAGAFTCNDRLIAVGTYSGWAIFDANSFACVLSDPAVLPPSCEVSGVQFDGGDLLLLGQLRSQTLVRPGDWEMRVFLSHGGQRPSPIHALPAGNWRMVRHAQGPQVCLYDVSEGAGVVSYDRHGLAWRVEMPGVKKVMVAGERLLCLEDQRLAVVDRMSGNIPLEKDLPGASKYCWTTIAGLTKGLVLGGYRVDSKALSIAVLDDDGEPASSILEHPLERVFSSDIIDTAMSEDCCGIDIYHVARILPLDRQKLVVALGGDGESLGACQGAAALAVIQLETRLPWISQVVDTCDGISGFTCLADGRYLVDLCGRIGAYALRPGF